MTAKIRVKNLVIGTGFSAWALKLEKFRDGHDAYYLDLSCLASQIRHTSTNTNLTNIEKVNLTARVGGGTHCWGGAMSMPDKSNWFAGGGGPWEASFDRLELERKYFPKSLKKFHRQIQNGSVWDSKNNPLTRGFVMDAHVTPFWWKYFGFKVKRYFGKNSKQAIELKLMKADGQSGVIIEYLDSSGNLISILAENTYLCSGPIINAALVHLLTGIQNFSAGNHWGRLVGKVRISKFRNLGRYARLRPTGAFLTYSRNCGVANSQSPIGYSFKNSIRLIPSSSTGSWDSLKKNPTFSNLFEFFRKQIWMPSQCDVLQILDSGLQKDAIRISSHCDSEGKLTFEVDHRSSIRKDLLELAFAEIEEFSSSLAPWLRFEINVQEFSDAAHYWGTVPMVEDDEAPVRIDQNMMLKDFRGVFCLGASAFPIGAHGHPTLLAMLTTQLLN